MFQHRLDIDGGRRQRGVAGTEQLADAPFGGQFREGRIAAQLAGGRGGQLRRGRGSPQRASAINSARFCTSAVWSGSARSVVHHQPSCPGVCGAGVGCDWRAARKKASCSGDSALRPRTLAATASFSVRCQGLRRPSSRADGRGPFVDEFGEAPQAEPGAAAEVSEELSEGVHRACGSESW